MKRRLVILTELIAPYRIPVFNSLAGHPEIDLHVIFLSETDRSLRQWPVYKEEIRFSHEVLPHWRRRIGKYNLLLNFGVGSSLDRIRPQAIVCGGYSYLSSWNAAVWARRKGVPLLLWSESTANDSRNARGIVESLKSRFLGCCRAFVVPGKSSFTYLCELGAPQQAIFTAPNAVDIDFFAGAAQGVNASQVRDRLELPQRFFLYVGRLVIEKGIFELLRAYAKLDAEIRAKIGLVFVGDGPARTELLHRIAAEGLESVRSVGFLHREELGKLYAVAEALVLPTHSDPWGLVVNEAMSCGLPVVTTSVAGCAADLVEDGWNGYIVPPGDVNGLYAALNTLARQPESREQMGLRSAQRIRAYSPQTWAAGLVKAVDFVCPRSA